MMVGFDATLGDGCGIWELREVKCLQGYTKTLWMGIQNL